MDNAGDFKKWGYKFVDYIAEYLEGVEKYPVKSKVEPGSILASFPESPPRSAQDLESSLKDINDKILPGITHWQHPRFHAYFPANNSYPSILGEMLTAGFGVQAMIWETSPAAAELEEVVMNWLKELLVLPEKWHGVIQDTASTATLVAILSAREKVSNFSINKEGFTSNKYRVYCSDHAHSSIDKAIKIAGIGIENLIRIPVNDAFEMRPEKLEAQIIEDIEKGFIPMAAVAVLGTTSSVAIDPIEEISRITTAYDIWLHVDAAYAGNAMILPEFREEIGRLEEVDSFVFNPHKWMFTNFDLSAYFVKDKEVLINTFSILPEYLRTDSYGKVNDYRDWGIQLGRRFRALKLWLVFQTFGSDKIRDMIREHVEMGAWFEKQIIEHSDFELITPRVLNVVVFRFIGTEKKDEFNKTLINDLNDSGKMFLSHTKLKGVFAIRMVIGNTRVNQGHVNKSWEQIKSSSERLKSQFK